MDANLTFRVETAGQGQDMTAWLMARDVGCQIQQGDSEAMSAGTVLLVGAASGGVSQVARVLVAWIRARSASIEVVDPKRGNVTVNAKYSAEEVEGILRAALADGGAADESAK